MGFTGCEINYSFSQTLDMPAGWSIISTYIEEQDADGNTAMVVDEIFSEINDEVIILKDYLGAAWLKEWNFNGVGSMEFGKGYQIKLNNRFVCCYFNIRYKKKYWLRFFRSSRKN